MKARRFLVLAFAVLVTWPIAAQWSDSLRLTSMGGAFIALADDGEALLHNPAGLGLISRPQFSSTIDGTGTLALSRFTQGYDDAYYGYTSPYFRERDGQWVVYDPFFGRDIPFDPNDFGYEYDPDDPSQSLTSFVQMFKQDQEARSFYAEAMRPEHFGFSTKLDYVDTGYGFMLRSNNRFSFEIANQDLEFKSPVNLVTTKALEATAGLAFGIDILHLGISARYLSFSTGTRTYPMDEIAVDIPQDFISTILLRADGDQSDSTWALGIGALVDLGTVRIGAHIPELLGPSSQDNPWDSLSLGLALIPADKDEEQILGIQLALGADLENLFSDATRELQLGAEFGFYLGSIVDLRARLGYRLPMTGSLDHAIETILGTSGEITAGLGLKLLFFQVDVFGSVASEAFIEAISGTTENLQDRPIGSVGASISLRI